MQHIYDPAIPIDTIRGKLVFIVNPVAGNGRGKQVWKLIEEKLQRDGIPYRAYLTSKPKEASQLAATLAELEPLALVAVGGDGTVHEIAAGIAASRSPCQVGHIPAGSGNDFARAHHIPLEPEAALNSLIAMLSSAATGESSPVAIDMLYWRGDWAVSSMGAGLDGLIAKLTNESGYKRMLNRLGLGFLAYPLSLLRALITYRPQNVTITIDEQELHFRKVWLIAVTNIDQYGGGMRITPDALPDDGYADVCIVSGISRIGLLLAFPRVYKGTHKQLKAVRLYRCRHVHIQSDKPLTIHADGEHAGETPVDIDLKARMLNIIRGA